MKSKETWIYKKGCYPFKLSENQDDTPDGQVRITQKEPIVLTVGMLRGVLDGVPDSTPVKIGTSERSRHLVLAHRAHTTPDQSFVWIDVGVPEVTLISKNIPAQEYASALLAEKLDMLLTDNDWVGGVKYDIERMLSDMKQFNIRQSGKYIRRYWIDTNSEAYDPEFITAHSDDIAKELTKRFMKYGTYGSWSVNIDKCKFECEDVDKAQLVCLISIAYPKETE